MSAQALAQDTRSPGAANILDEEDIRADPNGVTAGAVAKRAADTSYQAKASEEALRGAKARVDAAVTAYVPRLSTTFQYERLSEFTPPNLGTFVATTSPPGPITNVNQLQAIPFSFPLVLDNWLFQLTLNVPLTDYFLRISQGYTSATQSRTAARYDLGAARATAGANAKLTYYNWIRAKGALGVAKLALEDQKTHLTDTKNLFDAGKATQVDVLRGDTAVAAAELTVVQAQNQVDLGEKQVRIAMHVGDQSPVSSGEAIDGTVLPPVQGNLAGLISEGESNRFEVRSLDANAAAQREQARIQRAAFYPAVGAFGDVIVANPNPRIFPATQTWFPTWDVGVRLTWSPNDIPSAMAGASDAESRAAGLEAQKQVVRDGIAVEVTQAYQAVQEADFSLGSSAKQLTSAREAVRVARELFKAGQVNSTTLTDAETELTRARLAVINARIDARTARVRLEHALGRDAKLDATP